MSGEIKITIRAIELQGGGFVLAEERDEEEGYEPLQAVSTIDELAGAVGRRLRDWNTETRMLRMRQEEDETGKIIAPRRWWRAVK